MIREPCPEVCAHNFFAPFPPARHLQGVSTRETRPGGMRKKGDAYYCTFRFQGQRYTLPSAMSESVRKAAFCYNH
jgi:hypothetical protein